MSFKPSYAENNFWMRPTVKPDGFQYYGYILIYLDDLLIISHQTDMIVDVIKRSYHLKDDEVGPTKTCLGARVRKYHPLANTSKTQWSISAEQYIKNVVSNIETKLSRDGMNLNSQKYATTPFSNGYRPGLNVTPLLSDESTNFYEQIVGTLWWIVELG
jgi:hypothetical protein